MSVRDVIIVGAGPSGLATAIAAKHFGLDYVVLEQGALVDAIVRFPINMVFFTTPELLEIGGLPLTSPYDKPTRAEALQYYRKVVDTFQLQVSLFEQVTAIDPPAASGRSPRPEDARRLSAVRVQTRTSRGVTRIREARNVVLAMGYYDAAEHAQHPRRGSAARHALLQGSASVLPPARRHRRRQELRGRSRARDSSRRRPRHDGASRRRRSASR